MCVFMLIEIQQFNNIYDITGQNTDDYNAIFRNGPFPSTPSDFCASVVNQMRFNGFFFSFVSISGR